MKKRYMTPLMKIIETQTEQMMALSLQQDPANDSEVLVKENTGWDIWLED